MNFIDVFTQTINAFLHIYIIFFFLSIFCERKYNKLITAVSLAVMMVALACTLLFMPIGIFRFMPICILSFSVTLLFKIKIAHKFIYAAIIYAIIAIFEVLTEISISILFVNSFILNNSKSMFIVGMLISKTITFLVVLIIRLKKHNSLSTKLNKRYWSLLLLPLATLMLAILITLMFTSNPDQSIVTYILVLSTFAILIVSNLLIFDFIDTISEVNAYESKMAVADEIIKNQTAQYETLIKHDSEMHKLRHDHKNFCIGLLSELRAGNVDTAIESLTREYDIINAEHLMQSDIINSIVSIKRKAAEEHNAELHLNYNGANEINVAPTDLAIILGNALDNAIEACKNNRSDTPKIINMYVSVKNNVVYISMENPVQNTVDTKNLVSTKRIENEHHGFGIISMKQIAEKYNGEVLFSCEDNVFTTVIVLNNGKA